MKSVACLLALGAAALQAGTVTFLSGASSGCTSLNYDLTGQCNDMTYDNVTITPAGVYGTDLGGAEWISYENTGKGGITLANSTGVDDPTADFYLSFAGGMGVTVSITVWADDTAAVYLNGTEVSGTPDLTQSLADCAASGITCTGPGTTFTDLSAPDGTNTFEFEVYQTGGGLFGLMYDATADYPAPEPGSYLLLGSGLIALAMLRKRAF